MCDKKVEEKLLGFVRSRLLYVECLAKHKSIAQMVAPCQDTVTALASYMNGIKTMGHETGMTIIEMVSESRINQDHAQKMIDLVTAKVQMHGSAPSADDSYEKMVHCHFCDHLQNYDEDANVIMDPSKDLNTKYRAVVRISRRCGINQPDEQTKARLLSVVFVNSPAQLKDQLAGEYGYTTLKQFK